jgi:multidrug resistance efflux pump
MLENARREAERRRLLAEYQTISHDEAERDERASQVAQAEFQRASEEFSFVDANAREEDRRKAEAAVASDEAQLSEARAYLGKTNIRSPLGGVVLRKFGHAGGSVSTQFDSPVVTLADDSSLGLRLDVDKSDVAKLFVGQPAFVAAETYGKQKFTGHVIRVGRIGERRTFVPTNRVSR